MYNSILKLFRKREKGEFVSFKGYVEINQSPCFGLLNCSLRGLFFASCHVIVADWSNCFLHFLGPAFMIFIKLKGI
jgi:hypothetical protein